MPRQTKEPAFPVPPSPGFSKEEFAALVIASGIFAGPYGKTVMDSTAPDMLDAAADTAIDMYEALIRRIKARAA